MAPTHRRRTLRAAGALACCLLAALVATGCGGDDEVTTTVPDEPVKVREVTKPTTDEDLAEELGTAGEELVTAGCTFGTYELDDAEHVDVDEQLGQDHFPPTGGRHYADWAPFGIYDEPIHDGFVIHNLEHGGVAVWLGTEVDDSAITKALDDEVVDDEEKWIVAPRDDIEGLFSAAWGKGLSCPPEAVTTLGTPEEVAEALDEWYSVVVSTGSEAEKDVPAYAGAMKEPSPDRDISQESPF